jgi:hypothetical protein
MDERDPISSEDHDDLRVSGLASRRTGDIRVPGVRWVPWHNTRFWRTAVLTITVAALAAIILSALPGGDLNSVIVRFAQTTATAQVTSAILKEPNSPNVTPQPTAALSPLPAPALATAPASCAGGLAVTLSPAGPPYFRAIGHAPIWLSGFNPPNATILLGSSANPKTWGSWDAPYTQYGWPATVILVSSSSNREAVTLTGSNIQTGQVVSFGFVTPGGFGAPTVVSPAYTLDPQNPWVPPGGEDNTGVFWYGYVFVPQAGCYQINATWPDGGWHIIVSAGQ